MESSTQPSPAPGNRKKQTLIGGLPFLWVGIGVLLFLAAGFLLSTTILFRSAYTEPKQRQAKDVLTALFESEMNYFSQNHCFSDDPAAIGFSPAVSSHYEWAIIGADCTFFVARAWANLDSDPNLDIWEITNKDAFRPLHVFDDEKDIGYRIDPRSTKRWRPEDGHFRPPVSGRQ
jgi:hypothetical protein